MRPWLVSHVGSVVSTDSHGILVNKRRQIGSALRVKPVTLKMTPQGHDSPHSGQGQVSPLSQSGTFTRKNPQSPQ